MNNIAHRLFGQLAQSAAQKLRVRSALNPILWLCGIATPICFVGAYIFRDYSHIFQLLIYSGPAPIVVACVGFVYFAIFRPEKLQSEDYQLRHESLQIIQQKTGQTTLYPSSLEAIANPESKQIESTGDK